MKAPRKRPKNGRTAEEALTQKEIKGEVWLAGVLQEKAMSWPGRSNLGSEG